ncbi:MAG: CtsR family transcriptional regulator [Saccharofermentanales bacterium]|nr:CtsR family transcriptional regulator [Eubacteriales bacterium]MDD3611361.1 CtsR family transcriptional regulator [Eubacteriales bacterium]HHU03829.1 CtsR family transcriptional regulator [Fastidiosipila sp.]
MASKSDHIEQMIKKLLLEHGGYYEISRNSFAEKLNVVPSQISYVIETRFKTQHGYLVESRRGSGGSIRIRRVTNASKAQQLMQLVEESGTYLGQQEAFIALRSLSEQEIITPKVEQVMRAAMSNKSLNALETDERDLVRAGIFRNMLTSLAALAKEE